MVKRSKHVRNVKYLTHAPIDGRALIFDDVDENVDLEENVEVSAEDHECVKEPVIITRSGPTASKDYIYY